MHKLTLKVSHSDQRGDITDVVTERVDGITEITFVPGAIRGNHVHFETTQWTYVISGQLIVSTLIDEKRISITFKSGEVFVSLPGEPHAFEAISDCKILVFTQGPRSGKDYETDTVRMKII